MDKQDIAQTYARRVALNASPLVQRAIQRLHDNIARREMNLDLEAIKAVLVEMANQKERADLFEDSLVKAYNLVYDRLGAYRKGHAQDATAWEHFNTGFAEGMAEALGIVEAVLKDAQNRRRAISEPKGE